MISFSGIDGAGKTTQIEILTKHFESKGIVVERFWGRGGYTPGIEQLKKLLRKLTISKIPSSRGKSPEHDRLFSNPIIRKTWLIIAMLDLAFFYGIYIRIKEISGTLVICDRYILDTYLDFKLNFPNENFKKWWLWKFLNWIVVKPKTYYVLTIPIKESQRRSILKNEPFPDSEIVLKNRLAEYLNFSSNHNTAIHIDCCRSIEEIHNTIISHID